MRGADEYYDLFKGKSEQIGRLFFQPHTHARGKCFEIFVIPDGIEVVGSTIDGANGSVEVYGVTGGQRGWTETYGWIHKGKWQEDFESIINMKRGEAKDRLTAIELKKESTKTKNTERTTELLSSY